MIFIDFWCIVNPFQKLKGLQSIASPRCEIDHGVGEGAASTASTAKPQLPAGANGQRIAWGAENSGTCTGLGLVLPKWEFES